MDADDEDNQMYAGLSSKIINARNAENCDMPLRI